MRVVLQRVSRAAVAIHEGTVAEIGRGLLLLVGVAQGDAEDGARRLATKAAELRIFPDNAGKFNLSPFFSRSFLFVAELRRLGAFASARIWESRAGLPMSGCCR